MEEEIYDEGEDDYEEVDSDSALSIKDDWVEPDYLA